MKNSILAIVTLAIVGFTIWFWSNKIDVKSEPQFVADAYYVCDAGKQIKAKYYEGEETAVQAGERPLPSGKVDLELDDGRKISLHQTISGSGIRYASSDELFVFWSKGSQAFITEDNKETYFNCLERIWSLPNGELDSAVHEFLLSRRELSWQTEEGTQNICVFQNLYPEKELFPLYLWVRCGEFKMKDGKVAELSGTSVPVKIDYPNELSYYDLSKFSIAIPGDGALYARDIKTIFPKEILDRLNFSSSPLNEKISQKAEAYFPEAD